MAENIENNGCSQRDNAEHEGYVKASRSFNRIWKERDSAQPRLLEAILYKDNFNRAYKRVKANKGVPGIDGMTIEKALPYLKEHQQELTDRIYRGKYTPSPVRRVEIPKPDGGVRKLGIPTVIDRTLQQAITQQLVPIYEPLFADGSYGYRPNRSAKDAILKVKEYAEQGYTFAVVLDLSKYFDTLNHEILINLLRKNVKDERVVQLIKCYLKSGVMENGEIRIRPTIPDEWSCYRLEKIKCQEKELSTIYDKTGEKYHREKGFQVWCNGECIHKSLYPEEIKVAR